MHWLDRYATDYHAWSTIEKPDLSPTFSRRMGVVESCFDSDGNSLEGRADMNIILTLEVRGTLNERQLRRKILLSWACLRMEHVMFASTVPHVNDEERYERTFTIECPEDSDQAVRAAQETLTFVGDEYTTIDEQDFCYHVMNAARYVDERKGLARLLILPSSVRSDNKTHELKILLVAAHKITDGLATQRDLTLFTQFLNKEDENLSDLLKNLITPKHIHSILPKAQEDLYNPVKGSLARQRWFWAISRIFRHVKTPPPYAFANPLLREDKLVHPLSIGVKYDRILDYGRVPPLTSGIETVTLSQAATRQLQRLCQEVGVSIGSGCFSLVAIVMMRLEEIFHPDNERRPFVASFPINSRPFFAHGGHPASLMLAFSYGIGMSFLASDLPLSGRFKLLARQADTQLRVYQKGARGLRAQKFGSRSPEQLIPSNYLSAIERAEMMIKSNDPPLNPQGDYPASQPQKASRAATGATCGISSVGSQKNLITRQPFTDGDSSSKFQARAKHVRQFVRVRDGEFLIVSAGDEHSMTFNVSYDANTIDVEKVKVWKQLMGEMMEPEVAAHI